MSNSWELCSIWKSHNLLILESSTSDVRDNFSFDFKLYNASFVKEIDNSNKFFFFFSDNY